MTFRKWLFGPLPWWKFWCPGSGAPGGLIAGMILLVVVLMSAP